MRRYDIDWLRVITIGLLLIYHVAIGFQPWGMMIAFITNPEPWLELWFPMAALNVWRIPLLFFVSGMGVYFAMQQRSWKELIMERTWRIWLPFVFGSFAIAPLHLLLFQSYYKMDLHYQFNPGHLWFLANIFAYVVFLSPILFFLKRKAAGSLGKMLKSIFGSPYGLILVATVFIAEALIVKPVPYELYAMTWHGFALGMLAFFFGFCFVLSGQAFWDLIQKWRWVLFGLALIGFGFRQFYFGSANPPYLLVAESQAWIMAVLAFGSKHLNKPSPLLNYLSKAAYPVYILHMVFLYLGSILFFPLSLPVPIKFFGVLAVTVAGCFGAFEVLGRVPYLRALFGLKP